MGLVALSGRGKLFAATCQPGPEHAGYDCRELLLLKYDTGYSEKEIAQLLGMTEANVKKTIQRAKAKLQTLLDEMEADV